MKNKNLITLSSDEARENGKKGGLKSVEVRRKKKLLRELVNHYGVTDVPESTRKKLIAAGIGEDEFVRDMEIVAALYGRAAKGDVAAFNAIRDIKGEKPTENVAVDLPRTLSVQVVDVGAEYLADSEQAVIN
ncbi:MAG: hypothetical protein ILA06_04905 [Bacteroidaceae bacterium]|nr:hypothetical protein [Bacteroidaceae bacterium]